MAKKITTTRLIPSKYEVWVGDQRRKGKEGYGAYVDVTPQIVERYLQETTTDNVKKISTWLKKEYGLIKSVSALRAKLTHEGVYIAQTPKKSIKATDAVSNTKKDIIIRILQRTGVGFKKMELMTRTDLTLLEEWLKKQGYKDNLEKQILDTMSDELVELAKAHYNQNNHTDFLGEWGVPNVRDKKGGVLYINKEKRDTMNKYIAIAREELSK